MKKTAPYHVVSELRNYDPDLRIRWSRQKGCWAIERKVSSIDALSKPVKWIRGPHGSWEYKRLPEYSEKYIQFHDRYAPILYATVLDRRLFIQLYSADGWRHGYKGKYYAQREQYIDEKKYEKKESKDREVLEDTGKEALGYMQWKSGERMSLHGINSGNSIN